MEEQYKDIERLVKEAGLDTPSPEFMQNVMKQIEISETQKLHTYKPLISKKSWFVISLITVTLLFGLIFLPENKGSIFSTIDFSFLKLLNLSNVLSGFILPKAAIYGVFFLGVLFFVQVTLLKKRIDRSFSI